MQHHFMPDGHVFTDNQRIAVWIFVILVRHMQHTAVLNIGARADHNVVHITASRHQRPNTGVITNLDVANENGTLIYIDTFTDLWSDSFITTHSAHYASLSGLLRAV